MKTELEEVAKKLYPFNDGFQVMDIDISEELQLAFINGAKWQQKNSYSEEEVRDYIKDWTIMEKGLNINFPPNKFENWFEQFKKKIR
jgi:hypothetical protein